MATHGATSSSPAVGVERDGTAYELFVSTLPSPAFTCPDVLDLYLHRGSFEAVLADEDQEQDMDRWYFHTPCGQEFCQILAQWVWNLRLELGQTLSPSDLRTTEFATAVVVEPPLVIEPASAVELVPVSKLTPQVQYGPPQWARPSFTGGFPGSAFPCNQMGRCVAQLIVPSTHKSAGRSATAPCGCCMLRASVIVEAVPCVRSVKKAVPVSNPGG